jgi:hypothetical protein
MLRITAVLLISLSLHSTAYAQKSGRVQAAPVSDAVMQDQAERELKEIDCQITANNLEIDNHQFWLQDNIERAAPLRDARDDIIAGQATSYTEGFKEWLGESIYDAAVERSFVDLAAMKGYNIARAANIIGRLVEFKEQVDTFRKWNQMKGYVRQIDALSEDFKYIRESIGALNEQNKLLYGYHETKAAQWESRGVIFQRSFYGYKPDCNEVPTTFDGVWADNSDKAFVEIRGNVLRYLVPMHYDKMGTPCETRLTEFLLDTPTKGEVHFRDICKVANMKSDGIDNLELVEGKINWQRCRKFDGQSGCGESLGDILTKIGD